MPHEPTTMEQRVRLRNTTGHVQELWIEPLGDRVSLDPGVLYELHAGDALEEIELSEGGFVVFGWITRVTALSEDGTGKIVWELPK